MSTTPNRRSRSRRSTRSEQLYTARTLPRDILPEGSNGKPYEDDYASNAEEERLSQPGGMAWDGSEAVDAGADDSFLPNEEAPYAGAYDEGFAEYMPNDAADVQGIGEPYGDYAGYTPNDVADAADAQGIGEPYGDYAGYTSNDVPNAADVQGVGEPYGDYAGYVPNDVPNAADVQGVGEPYGDYAGYVPNESDNSRTVMAANEEHPVIADSQAPVRIEPKAMQLPRASVSRTQAVMAAEMGEAAESEDDASAAAPAAGSLAANLAAYYRRSALDEVRQKNPLQSGESAALGGVLPTENGVKLGYRSMFGSTAGEENGEAPVQPLNVYRPRAVTWAEPDEREAANAAQSKGYQVEAEKEEPRKRRRRKHRVRRVIVVICIVAVLAGGAWIFREPIGQWIGTLTGSETENSATLAAVATAAPVHGYDAAASVQISANTASAISQLAGTVELEPVVVTEDSVMTSVLRENGNYDYYLFGAADGRLLAYFENLTKADVAPMPDGGFYVRQAPYLINADGTKMLQLTYLEQNVGQSILPHPLMNGWAMVETADGQQFNYVDPDGQLLSRLWFAKAFPMTGQQTVGYVDTGNMADQDSRYALYVADAAGTTAKWKDAGSMDEVLTSACGAAYLENGELYLLNDISAPLVTTPEVSIYVDCDAMVVRDPQTGKYGLFAHGEQHYDYLYDSIEPVSCDIQWDRQVYQGQGGQATVCTVTGAEYPQPLSHYFLLKNGAQEEYVALSTSSLCPVLLK